MLSSMFRVLLRLQTAVLGLGRGLVSDREQNCLLCFLLPTAFRLSMDRWYVEDIRPELGLWWYLYQLVFAEHR